ncbi:uncharacterized protein AMSG_02505 [Thecamonas trahens ATCC 50062]|uniref:[histone H3]-trimethyl-L-lysine(4) demethylase n=1 Tax=Thecamonas trahens ATCC 50062 TaxID=461836 RepID=A0A0L0D860_THETB|nr:hypothetical protein AMSG_02505 [Thecamonas trahens ATCC 50062]KNC47488.1 hypothetical protein AMSG_02505 [Thecamonas trahens ATCC 50062]|eukprot:XP_013759424.1 hypothetical protein AMSG_02505 [Thecamonas trahens ATCC 50062]
MPVFYPRPEDMRDVMGYVASIAPAAAAAGVAKIVPPPGWAPPFALDSAALSFRPRIQTLNTMNGAVREALNYADGLLQYHLQQGAGITRLPTVLGVPIDVHALRNAVAAAGGADAVDALPTGWYDIACTIGIEGRQPLALIEDYEAYRAAARIATTSFTAAPAATHSEVPACGFCESPHADSDALMACDACGLVLHFYCVQPALPCLPDTEYWLCPACLAGAGPKYGFEQADRNYTLPEFEAAAAKFKIRHLPDLADTVERSVATACSPTAWRPPPRPSTPPSADDLAIENYVEQKYWDAVHDPIHPIDTMYGADLPAMVHGSGFPVTASKSASFNLNRVALSPQSMFSFIDRYISGCMSPWLYVGMLYSTFCWHNEDHYTYSLSYLHWGETKTWYGVPSSHADAFEACMRASMPELFEDSPDLLSHIVTMLSPQTLLDAGVKVVVGHQRPGEFMVTFPRAYHGGFSHGFNFGEAANFALPDWIPYGALCLTRYASLAKLPVFSHERLLCRIALFSSRIDVLAGVAPHLRALVEAELDRRAAAAAAYDFNDVLDLAATVAPETYVDHLAHLLSSRSLSKLCKNRQLASKRLVKSQLSTMDSRMAPAISRMVGASPADPSRKQDFRPPLCAVCHSFLYLSFARCTCGVVSVCWDHAPDLAAGTLCSCHTPQLVFAFMHSEGVLLDLVDGVEAKVTAASTAREHLLVLLARARNGSGLLSVPSLLGTVKAASAYDGLLLSSEVNEVSRLCSLVHRLETLGSRLPSSRDSRGLAAVVGDIPLAASDIANALTAFEAVFDPATLSHPVDALRNALAASDTLAEQAATLGANPSLDFARELIDRACRLGVASRPLLELENSVCELTWLDSVRNQPVAQLEWPELVTARDGCVQSFPLFSALTTTALIENAPSFSGSHSDEVNKAEASLEAALAHGETASERVSAMLGTPLAFGSLSALHDWIYGSGVLLPGDALLEPTLLLLRKTLLRPGKWQRAAEVLLSGESNTPEPCERAVELLARAAKSPVAVGEQVEALDTALDATAVLEGSVFAAFGDEWRVDKTSRQAVSCRLLAHQKPNARRVTDLVNAVSVACEAAKEAVETIEAGASIADVYCLCRGPEEGQMVLCDVCAEWFHVQCVGWEPSPSPAAELVAGDKRAHSQTDETSHDTSLSFACPLCTWDKRIWRHHWSGRPSLEQVRALAASLDAAAAARGQALRLTSLHARLVRIVDCVDAWATHARAALAAAPPPDLDETKRLYRIGLSMEVADEAVEAALAQAIEVGNSALLPPATLYCTCREPWDESREMIGCDGCQDWFHSECVAGGIVAGERFFCTLACEATAAAPPAKKAKLLV